MSKDEFDLYRHLRKGHSAFDLIRGLEDRNYGQVNKSARKQESLDFYAEEQFIKKREFNELRCEMPGLPRSTFLMVFSPDGTRVASTHGNHNIYISDVRSGKNIKTLAGHPRTPWCIAFHPTSNQIVASGCLGGQVRIWDLSGGSEAWTAVNQTVIASLAFHPNDRLLAIATYNQVYFWDWSQPEPFVQAATNNPKEKVRYVAFDKLGHKLITGIANTPQTRWERVRAPVPIPRQERSSGSYRRRITQRLVGVDPGLSLDTRNIPDRERRITTCYRNLVREYEQLVHRYLQLYRPPTMIDRGTDPMEPNPWCNNSGTQTSEPSTSQGIDSSVVPNTSSASTSSSQDWSIAGPSSQQEPSSSEPLPSTSREEDNTTTSGGSRSSPSIIKPSRIFSVINKPPTLIRSTQTLEDRKHKADDSTEQHSPSKKQKTSNIKLIKKSSRDNKSTSEKDTHKRTLADDRAATSRKYPRQEKVDDVAILSDSQCIQDDTSEVNATSTSAADSACSTEESNPISKNTDESTSARSHDKYSLERDSTNKTDNSTSTNNNTTNNQQDERSSSSSNNTAKRTPEASVSNPKNSPKAKKPIMVIKIKSTTIDTTSTPTITSTSGLRLRIPLDDNDSNVRATFEHSLLGNSTINVPSTSNASSSQQGASKNSNSGPNTVDELLSSIRRTAEEEVRNRILPIIRSVPLNDRPELIRLFENSRENVRMRFRQMYPVIPRKPNRRFPNIPYPTTDSSSSSSEEDRFNNSANNRLSSFSVDSTSNPQRPTQRADSTATPVRNFNTQLEELVISLLSEMERTDNRAGRMVNASNNVDCVVTASTTGTSATLPTTVPSTVFTSAPVSEQPSTSQNTATATNSSEGSGPLAHLLFQECLQTLNSSRDIVNNITANLPITLFNNFLPPTSTSGSNSNTANNTPSCVLSSAHTPSRTTNESSSSVSPLMDRDPMLGVPATVVNTNTGTTNSTIYTSNSVPRRRFFSHRISAFLPTRVNYTRSPPAVRGRSAPVLGRVRRVGVRNPQTSFALDELINFSERENSEEDTQNSPYGFSPLEPHTGDGPALENFNFTSVYSNILHEIESSLTDVIEIGSATRVERSSRLLSNFSDRLENIDNQSDSLLRNLAASMDLLSNNPDVSRQRSQGTEPTANFFDPSFYVRDQRDGAGADDSSNDGINVTDLFNNTTTLRAVSADHTYPRNPNDSQSTAQPENMNPLMSSIHVTISHIQRQARLLREHVEVIERMDRSIEEVSQLQLMRRMIIDLTAHLRTISSNPTETRNSTGMSSVRQMMAGTRISDSSPTDLTPEETYMPGGPQQPISSNDANTNSSNTQNRARISGRKTYPPSRLHRFNRQCRRPILQFFSRRYLNRADRLRHASHPRSAPRFHQDTTHNQRDPIFSPFSIFSNNNLVSMTRRFELLLTEQMRVFSAPQHMGLPTSNATSNLGEHILALRLHGCIIRMNRAFRDSPANSLGNYTADDVSAVSPDGISRYAARHTLSLLIDNASRHLEIGRHNISPNLRNQIHRVLAMAFLLTELMLAIITDSVPASNTFELSPSNEVATLRLCTQILRSRYTQHSHQLSRSLRLMRLIMRHAQTTLRMTYVSRRRELIPGQTVNRLRLLGCINGFLRSCKERQAPASEQFPSSTRQAGAENQNQQSASGSGTSTSSSSDWYNAALALMDTYSHAEPERRQRNEQQPLNLNNSRDRVVPPVPNDLSDNSDGEDDEQPTTSTNNNSSQSSNLYRSNNMNLLQSVNSVIGLGAGGIVSSSHSRPWNVPSVQVNDVPISEPSTLTQRIITHRQRFAERVSELRSNPSLGLFRPRFLHPLYSSVNPFDADIDDVQRDQLFDSDIITTVTPNHRIQAWDISDWNVPIISNTMKNLVVSECKIHNDASVDVAKDGTILVTLLPSGGYLNVTNRLGVYSLRWETLGQCLYTTSFEQNAVSVSLSPLSRHLVVGLASRIMPSERFIMARVFKIDQKDIPGDRLPVVRELDQNRDSRLNCIRWLPNSGQGLIYATNTGQLVILS